MSSDTVERVAHAKRGEVACKEQERREGENGEFSRSVVELEGEQQKEEMNCDADQGRKREGGRPGVNNPLCLAENHEKVRGGPGAHD